MTVVRDHWWWRPGWKPGRRFYTFHFTFEAQPAVQRLAAEVRERLGGFAALDMVPGRWLHLTTQGIGFADEVGHGDVMAIVSAARDRLSVVRSADITVSAPHAASEGVASYIGPPGALDPARDALRAAISDVWGPGKVPEAAEWSPHVSYAYANADAEGGPYDAALGGLGPVHAAVTTVELICLGRDRRIYEWETIASLPLGDRG